MESAALAVAGDCADAGHNREGGRNAIHRRPDNCSQKGCLFCSRLVYADEPGGVVSDGNGDSAQLRIDCVEHIAGEGCKDPPCVNLMN